MTIKAGISKIEISSQQENVKVNDPLYAKVIVFDDTKKRSAIIALDAVAIGGICDISDDFMNEIRSSLSEAHEISEGNIIINATHTHTAGPMLCDEETLIAKVLWSFGEAVGNMVDVRIGAGSGYDDTYIINRTLRLKNGLHWSIRQANPCPKDEEIEDLGPIDPRIGILKIEDEKGSPHSRERGAKENPRQAHIPAH